MDSEYLFLMLVDQLQIVLYERKVVTGHWDILLSSPVLPSDTKFFMEPGKHCSSLSLNVLTTTTHFTYSPYKI